MATQQLAPGALAEQYAAAREATGVIALSERGLLGVTGPLREKYLNNMLSNDLAGRPPGQGCLAALMDVKGRVQALMRVLVTKDAVLLELPADRLAPVHALLLHHKVGAPVRFEERAGAVLALLGPAGRSTLARAGCELPELAPESHATGSVAGHELRVARASDLPCAGHVVHCMPEAVAAVRDALAGAGAVPVGREALDALRVEQGRAWYGPDVGEEHLLHETGLLREYHSASKGCYLGQELVARLEGRGGHVNKALRGLRLSAPARAGDPVVAEGREVGRVTTAAVSPRLGPIAMGYVHRSHFEPGTRVEVAGAAAEVVALPFAP